MKMNKNMFLSFALLCCSSFAASADDLTKEITVAKDFVPTEQKATKSNALPSVVKSDTKKTSLNYSDWAIPTAVPVSIPVMTPYGYATTHDFSSHRGYLDIAGGSFLNFIGSAGYRIIDKEKTSLGIWLQHNSTWTGLNNTADMPNIGWTEETVERQKQKYNDNTIGFDFKHDMHSGILTASADYHYDHFNYYGGFNFAGFSNAAQKPIYSQTHGWNNSDSMQTVNEFKVNLGWSNHSTSHGLNYSANLFYDHFGFSTAFYKDPDYKGMKENHARLNLNAEFANGNESRLGLNLIGNYLNHSYIECYYDDSTYPHYKFEQETQGLGMITLSPYYKFSKGNFNANIGLNLNISFSDGGTFNLSPNVDLSYRILDGLAIYGSFKGGKELSTLSDMYTLTRYLDPLGLPDSSFSPFDGEAGLKIGPFAGFYASVYGGYGIFKGISMPSTPSMWSVFYRSIVLYSDYNRKGLKVGGEVGYKYASIAEAKASVVYAPRNTKQYDYDDGYVLGEDCAKAVINASVKVTPIDRLAIGIDYQLRAKRAMIAYNVELSNVNLLNLGASYQVTDMVTVFAQANNLLNKQWDTYYGMSAQKMNFLGGISLVF